MLDAGAQLVLRSFLQDDIQDARPLAHIRVQDVVRQVSESEGVATTTGALYNIWESQQEYQRDLMVHILREAADPAAEPLLRMAGELFAQRLPIDEINSRLADESLRLDAESQIGRAARAFAAFTPSPGIVQAVRSAHDSRLETGRVLYSMLLKYAGLRVREPYSLDQLITVIGVLGDGLGPAREIVPDLFEVPDGSESLFAMSASAIFYRFCEPIPPDPHVSER